MTRRIAQRWLAGIWIFGFIVISLLLLIQTAISDIYGDEAPRIWNWFKDAVVPTVTLMLGVVIVDIARTDAARRPADRFVFTLSVALSAVYLSAIMVIIGVVANTYSFDAIERSRNYLEIYQGLVAISIGAFFGTAEKQPVS